MKKLLLLAPALALAACAPAQTGPATATRDAFGLNASVQGEAVTPTASAAGWLIDRPAYSLLVDFNPRADGFRFGVTPTQGFTITVVNKGTTALKVIWDETTVSLRGNTSGVIPDGVKFIDAERSKPALIVPPGVTTNKEITPVDSVTWTGRDWNVAPLFPANLGKSNVTLYMTIEGEKKEGVTLNFVKR